jgi:hypothetical protein
MIVLLYLILAKCAIVYVRIRLKWDKFSLKTAAIYYSILQLPCAPCHNSEDHNVNTCYILINHIKITPLDEE